MRGAYGLGLLGATAALLAPVQAQTGAWRFHADHVLGTSLDLTVVAQRPMAAALAIDAARSEIARLDRILSTWRSDSELMALNTAPVMTVSPDLFAVIAACEEMRTLTGGAYSARIGKLLHGCPSAALLAQRIAHAGLRLDAAGRIITRPAEISFAVDGLAKGYIIDRALAAARAVAAGVDGMMVDIGGDLKCWGTPPSGNEWRIGLVDAGNAFDNSFPLSHIRIGDGAVATSGRNVRRQPLIAPATGAQVTDIAYATVTAPSAAQADALATAFCVLPPRESMAMADRLDGVSARILTMDGISHTSARWMSHASAAPLRPLPIADANMAGAPWPAGFTLGVDYEVPKIDAGTYHNPYVAIWITDENRALVRTLLVLSKDPKYREEMYVYWRRFGRLDPKLVDSVTRPTRAPGHYSVSWDGKNDAGQKVPQGKYTINIEASRERGGHSNQRIDVTIGSAEFSTDAAADGELGKSSARFGRGT